MGNRHQFKPAQEESSSPGIQLTAPSALCARFERSYGATTVTISFLSPLEVTQLQALSKWWYKTAVSRVQKRVFPLRKLYFSWYHGGSLTAQLVEYSLNQQPRCLNYAGEEKFSHVGWSSCQVNERQLFQQEGGSENCRMLHIDALKGSFTAESRRSAPLEVFNQCLVFVPQSRVFSIGGQGTELRSLNSVHSYETERDAWESQPSLNQARVVAGACYLGTSIYVFCGYNSSSQFLNTIEKLDFGSDAGQRSQGSPSQRGAIQPVSSEHDSQSTLSWQLIEPTETQLAPRWDFIVCALTSTEIAILGGCDKDAKYITQITIFNTRTQRCQAVEDAKNIQLNGPGNQSAQVNSNTLAALVRSRGGNPTVIRYTKDGDNIQRVFTLQK